jgi:predicted nucleotidyltransferase
MPPVVQQHLGQIEALCRKYGVLRLEAFGSMVRGDFDPATSDIDLLVLFQKSPERDAADRFFGLLEELEKLFGRKVDLVDIAAARNPYFIAEARRHRMSLYAA